MSVNVKALIVLPDGSAQVREIGSDLDSLKSAVGGWLEAIHPTDHSFGVWHAYCDEEGKIKNLPINAHATRFAHAAGWPPGDLLVGTVVFLGSSGVGEDYMADEGDVPDALVNLGWDMLICS